MIKSTFGLLFLKVRVTKVIRKKGTNEVHPAEEEFVREYVKVMEPISEALDVLQADVKISIGYLLPTLTILLQKMEHLKEKGAIKHCKPLLNTMIESVKRRFAASLVDEELLIAAMVHPLFKAKWIPEGEERDDNIQRHRRFSILQERPR